MVSKSVTAGGSEHARPGHAKPRPAVPILAISSRGTIKKANLQARRPLGEEMAIEGAPLGVFLAHLMARRGKDREQALIKLVGDNDEPIEILLVMSDSDEPSEVIEEPAPRQEQAAGNIADFIAHELRNNIAVSLGLSQLLETNFESIEPAERVLALKGIQTEAEHALLVLDGLLKLVESRRTRGAPGASVPLHSVLHRVIAAHKRRHPARTFVITGDAPVFATGHSTWITLAIGNLIANAEKVTPRERAIQISVLQEAERAIVLVMDQGRALSTPVYDALWDIYSKGPPEGIEITGSGIGLSLCKELVEAMGGHVWAGPRSGGGSAFAITFHCMPEDSDSDLGV